MRNRAFGARAAHATRAVALAACVALAGCGAPEPAEEATPTPEAVTAPSTVREGGVVDKQLPGRAVVAAARAIERLGIPAQPGVLLEGALDDLGTTARHGWLREPELFDRGTPLYREPDRLTLLLELVALTDDEYTIARDQGLDVLTRRLRRRGTNTTEWNRAAE